jgi:hypothetical protein
LVHAHAFIFRPRENFIVIKFFAYVVTMF